MATTVLIVDDHPGFRASARMLLEAEGFDVVGEAGDGRSGLDAAAELQPGRGAARHTAARHGRVRRGHRTQPSTDRLPAVVLISSRAREDLREQVEASPARGFIPKSELSGAALEALIG